MATSMTMDEMGELDKADEAAKAAETTPEQKEIADKIQRLETALRVSEDARVRAVATEAARAAAPTPAPAPAPVVDEGPKDLTAEELDAMVREDPTKALQMAMEQTRRRTTKDLEARLNPLVSANVTNAEQMARAKYADDFKILGPEIEAFMKTIPEAQKRVALGDPAGWETMLNYVRGQNMDKIVSARVDKAVSDRLGAARSDQAAAAPPSLTAGGTATPDVSASGLVWDATTIEIMKNVLNTEDTPKARAEWTKWYNAKSGG